MESESKYPNEKESKTKIIVCYHKKSKLFQNSALMPLLVGKYYNKNTLNNIQGDNSGDNISYKNNHYCELTGLYWMWKNVKAENYGLFHYRRFIDINNKYPEHVWLPFFNINDWDASVIDKEMEEYDIIMPTLYYCPENTYNQFKNIHFIEDIDLAMEIIKNDYPKYLDTAEEFFKQCNCYFCNMFIMKKNLFNEYCEWIFDILEKIETKISIDVETRDNYQQRVYGFISERLLNVFIMQKMKENPNLKLKQGSLLYIDDTMLYIKYIIGECILKKLADKIKKFKGKIN